MIVGFEIITNQTNFFFR